MEDEKTLGTFKSLVKDIWKDEKSATETISVSYVRRILAKPKGATVEKLYKQETSDKRAKCSLGSYSAQMSLAGRIVRLFDEQKKAGSWPKYGDAVAFVAKQGSLESALKTLLPDRVEKAPKVEPAKPATSKSVEVSTKVEESPKVDKFAQVVALVDELGEVDLKTLAMVVADKLAKFEAKATAKA